MDSEKIGKYIAKCRKNINLTQEELAEKLNLSSKTISKWECGNGLPDISIMLDLCYVLGTNIINLLGGEEKNVEYEITRIGGTMLKKTKPRLKTGSRAIKNLKDNPIAKIKDLKKDKRVTVEVKIIGYRITEIHNTLHAYLDVRDDTGNMQVYLKVDGKVELGSLLRKLSLNETYRLMGYVSIEEDTNSKIIYPRYIEKVENKK